MEEKKRKILVGISSFRQDCAKGPGPIVFTKLRHLVKWIFYQTDARKFQCY